MYELLQVPTFVHVNSRSYLSITNLVHCTGGTSTCTVCELFGAQYASCLGHSDAREAAIRIVLKCRGVHVANTINLFVKLKKGGTPLSMTLISSRFIHVNVCVYQ